MSFFGEIRRRKVFQVAAVYAVVAWLLVQVVATIEEPLSLPAWFDTAIIVLLAIGFPLILIVSWAFNFTSEGLVRESGNSGSTSGRTIEFVLIFLVAIAVGWLVYRVEFDASPAPETSAGSNVAGTDGESEEVTRMPQSVAVLPFASLSLDPEDSFFAAGIHDELLNQLAQIRDLTVIARTSVMRYAETDMSIREIADELRVEAIMEGTIRYGANRIRLTAQLVDPDTGGHLWSNTYDSEFDVARVFEIESDIATNIARELEARVLPAERRRISAPITESSDAYTYYLRALDTVDLITSYTAEFERAELHRYLDLAIEADPEFARAYATKALEYSNAMWQATDDRFAELRQLALHNANRALELDPEEALAHSALGMLYILERRRPEAERAFSEALQLNPNNPEVLNSYLNFLYVTDNMPDALTIARRLAELSPVGGLLTLSHTYLNMGRIEEALSPLWAELEINRSDAHLHFDIGGLSAILGDENEALERLSIAET